MAKTSRNRSGRAADPTSEQTRKPSGKVFYASDGNGEFYCHDGNGNRVPFDPNEKMTLSVSTERRAAEQQFQERMAVLYDRHRRGQRVTPQQIATQLDVPVNSHVVQLLIPRFKLPGDDFRGKMEQLEPHAVTLRQPLVDSSAKRLANLPSPADHDYFMDGERWNRLMDGISTPTEVAEASEARIIAAIAQQQRKPKLKRGGQRRYDSKLKKRIREAWATGRYKRRAELDGLVGIVGVTAKMVLDADRKKP